MDPSFAYDAGPGAQGLSWYVTFPAAAGDASSLVVSTENGPESVVASAGMLSGTDPLVRVAETVKGGLRTSMVRPNSGNVFHKYIWDLFVPYWLELRLSHPHNGCRPHRISPVERVICPVLNCSVKKNRRPCLGWEGIWLGLLSRARGIPLPLHRGISATTQPSPEDL